MIRPVKWGNNDLGGCTTRLRLFTDATPRIARLFIGAAWHSDSHDNADWRQAKLDFLRLEHHSPTDGHQNKGTQTKRGHKGRGTALATTLAVRVAATRATRAARAATTTRAAAGLGRRTRGHERLDAVRNGRRRLAVGCGRLRLGGTWSSLALLTVGVSHLLAVRRVQARGVLLEGGGGAAAHVNAGRVGGIGVASVEATTLVITGHDPRAADFVERVLTLLLRGSFLRARNANTEAHDAVSYTHLTLPTQA